MVGARGAGVEEAQGRSDPDTVDHRQPGDAVGDPELVEVDDIDTAGAEMGDVESPPARVDILIVEP